MDHFDAVLVFDDPTILSSSSPPEDEINPDIPLDEDSVYRPASWCTIAIMYGVRARIILFYSYYLFWYSDVDITIHSYTQGAYATVDHIHCQTPTVVLVVAHLDLFDSSLANGSH
ncbi:hypothetical protein BDQ17DRAFT_1324368 [Cyathus striatus]|nr:hypothetical protein BDQ17DRAFT_1324368 [Cyathus striatus]